MSNQTEINKMILDKIQKSKEDQSIKDFLHQILNFEILNSDKESVRFKEKYLELIQTYYSQNSSQSKRSNKD